MSRRIYTSNDINPMAYLEFGEVMGLLIKKIEAHISALKKPYDMVVPILRSGGIPGNAIAIHFGITRILPVQFKYFHRPLRIKQLITLPQLLQDVPQNPRILICETNTSAGKMAQEVVNFIQKHYPTAHISYATVAKVYGGPDSFNGIDAYFYGVLTNENFVASAEDEKRFGLRPKITIFPWEKVEDELRAINSHEND